MAIRIVRIGGAQLGEDDGDEVRIGAVCFPRRYAPKGSLYDIWLPELAPSRALFAERRNMALSRFLTSYRSEMRSRTPRHLIEMLVVLSGQLDMALGCYCLDDARCHRLILGRLLAAAGAKVKWEVET